MHLHMILAMAIQPKTPVEIVETWFILLNNFGSNFPHEILKERLDCLARAFEKIAFTVMAKTWRSWAITLNHELPGPKNSFFLRSVYLFHANDPVEF